MTQSTPECEYEYSTKGRLENDTLQDSKLKPLLFPEDEKENLKTTKKSAVAAAAKPLFYFCELICCTCCRKWKTEKKEKPYRQVPTTTSKILVIGLDNAGKTTLLHRIMLLPQMEKPYSRKIPTPNNTQGFHIKKVVWNQIAMEMWEVGGNEVLRPHWHRYLSASRGVIYVIDSKDKLRLPLAIEELKKFIKIIGRHIPLLVLMNKCSVDELGKITPGGTADIVTQSLNESRQLPYNLKIINVSAVPEGTDDEGISYAYSRELCAAIDWLAKGTS